MICRAVILPLLSSFWPKLRTPFVIAPCLRSRAHKFHGAHRCCPYAREKRRPWSRWLVFRKSDGGCPRDGHFFVADRFLNIKDSGLSQAVVEGWEAVCQKEWKGYEHFETLLAATLAGRFLDSRWPRIRTLCVPRTYGLLQQYCCVQQCCVHQCCA